MSELVCCWKISRQHKWLDFRTIKVVPRAKEDGLLPSEGTSFFGNAHEKIQPCVDVVWCGWFGVRVLETKGGEVWFHLFCPSVRQFRFILLDFSQSLFFLFTVNVNVYMAISLNFGGCVLFSAWLLLKFYVCIALKASGFLVFSYVLYFCECNWRNIGLNIPDLFFWKNSSDRGSDRLWPGSAPSTPALLSSVSQTFCSVVVCQP